MSRLKPEFTSMSVAMLVYVLTRATVDGLEEFLIMPTAWYYIELELGQTNLFLGLTLAAYSLGALVSAPVIGLLDDRFQITKTILLISAVLKFLGHLTYSIPVNAYFPLCGRLLSGFAGGSIGVLQGMIARYTPMEGRAKMFLCFGASFNFGTALAPSVGSILTFNFNILDWKISPGNSPGILLATIWLFMIIATVFCIPRNPGRKNSSSVEVDPDQTDPDEAESDEKSGDEHKTNRRQSFNYKIACMYFLIFMLFFIYCVTAFYVPLLAVKLFHLRLIHVKMLFINGTLIVFVGYCANYLASAHVQERKLVLFWLTVEAFPILLLLYFDVTWHDPNQEVGPYVLLLLIMVGLPCFSYPLILALLSKLTESEHAAFYLGFAATVGHLSIIASRFVAGVTFSATSMLFTLTGLTFFWLVQVIWYYTQYENLYFAPGQKLER